MRTTRCLGTLAGILLLIAVNCLGAGKLDRPTALGSIIGTKGTVQVDRHPVLANETIFAGESISTGETSGAFLNLHGTIAILVEKSELSLAHSDGSVSMTLKKGMVEIRTGNLLPTVVNVPGASVIVRGEGAFPSICRIASIDKSAAIYTEKGHVEVHGTGAPTLVRPGKTIRLEAGVPQAAGQQAGKVSALIPTGTRQQSGKSAKDSLKVADTVFWQDLVETQEKGRVRIALDGGSFLNIGARSQMRIVQHDTQTQQTAVELKLGSLRGEVVKLTKGGKFETKTPTAVIGVVGTIYIVNAAPKLTRVLCVKGVVTVHNIDPSVPGEVTLQAGQSTTVPQGKPPSTPTAAQGGEINTEMAQTDIQEGAVAGAGGAGGEAATSGGTTAGGAGGTGGGGFPGGALNLGTLGAAGAGAVAGAVGIHKISNTQDVVNRAQSSLSNAASAAAQAAADAAAAQNAANQALSNTQQLNNINNTIQTTINAILQGCGCVSPTVP